MNIYIICKRINLNKESNKNRIWYSRYQMSKFNESKYMLIYIYAYPTQKNIIIHQLLWEADLKIFIVKKIDLKNLSKENRIIQMKQVIYQIE